MVIDLHKTTELTPYTKKNRDFKLLFTSGCFDLLHSGHIYFFNEMIRKAHDYDNRQAKKFTTPNKDKHIQIKTLVVTHSDEMVNAQKGKGRPIFPAANRVLILDNLKQIDYVGVWDGWESIVDLVYAIEPDFLATNSDNLALNNWDDNWQKVAAKIGARLIGIPRVESDVSTTSFIEKIKGTS